MPSGLSMGRLFGIVAAGTVMMYLLMIAIEAIEQPKTTNMRPNVRKVR